MASEPSSMASNGLLVVSGVFSVVLAIVYLFYSNRILALLVGYLLRFSWWNEGSDRAWVSLESFQVSLLAGRVMIKDLRYHSSNQSFRAIKCRVTWRYWRWRTREDSHTHVGEEESKGNPKASTLPCRLHIVLEGVEWRLFNRTAAYNNILARLQCHSTPRTSFPSGHGSSVSGQSQDFTAFTLNGGDVPLGKSATTSNGADRYPPSTPATAARPTMLKATFSNWFANIKPDFHEILPIDLLATNGAIVFGNPSTPSLLVAKFVEARGSYSVLPSRSLHDKYKTVIEAKARDVRLDLQRNKKYRGSLVQQGMVVSRNLGTGSISDQLRFSAFSQLWGDQKRDETRNETDRQARMEADVQQQSNDYAIVETILETPQLDLSYYWDEPGIVPSGHRKESSQGLESHDVGNGGLAPQYGIDIAMHGGIARYGPWADRQRVSLQRLFFPPTYQTVTPTATLKPGDIRIYTALKVFIELRDATTLHIPFREPSKDWQFDETKFAGSSRKRREGGWLEVRVGRDSTINYVLPWTATQDGYDALLELHLDQVNALSSVNDMQLLKAESSRVLCQFPTPPRWNDSRRWTFDVSFRMPAIHVIRDHITLLTDLGKDWSAGPPSDFDRWIPMHYMINVYLQDFEITLYLNDQNIITHPHARDANTLLTIRGNTLRNSVEIPSTVFRPQFTKIPFWIEVPGVRLILTLPKWNTHATFGSTRTTDFGGLGFVRIDSSFLYYSETLPEHVDQLRIHLTGHDAVFILFGWLARHLMSGRDNYLGNFTHFSTLTEYVTKRKNRQPVGDPVEWKWREGKSNVLEVSLSIQVEHLVLVLPAGLQGYEHSLDPNREEGSTEESNNLGTCVVTLQPEFQLQLRTHDYSMEMSINFTPMILSIVEDLVHNLIAQSYERLGRQKLQIDGINILANRLFGPQPRTSTYLCLWEFQIGAITGVVSTMELRGLSAAISSFRINFLDSVNAPAATFAMPSEPDVTFVKLNLKSLDVAWVVYQIGLQLHIPQGIKLDFNDLAGSSYKKVTEIRIFHAVLRALLRSGTTNRETWLEAGSITFDVGVDIYSSPKGWCEAAAAQTKYIAAQDALTRRAWFLYEASSRHPSNRIPSAYHFSMFLPRLRFPTPSLHDEVRPGTRAPGNSRRRRSNMGSLTAVESDEDEHVSEADRDARLAHSRPATPLMFNVYDDRSMSSSDESDNDITSDSSDSDSDEAELDKPNVENVRAPFPSLSHYKNIVRRFQSHLDYTSMFQFPSLFSLVRTFTNDVFQQDMALPLNDLPKTTPSAGWSASQSQIQRSPDPTLASIVRLIRSNDVEVLVTPLCVHVIKSIFDEISSSNTSLELVIDSITTQYLLTTPTETNVCASQNSLDAGISSFRLRILQTLVNVDEAITPLSVNAQSLDTPLLTSDSRIVSDIVLSLHDLTASFSRFSSHSKVGSKTSTTLRGSLSKVRAHLDMSVSHPLSPTNRGQLQVSRQCAFELDESKVISTSDNFHMELGDTRLEFLGKASPEVIIASLDSIASIVREAATHAKRTRRTTRQHQIWSTLRFCRSIHMDDPLAMTQPSLLVQEGRPQHMRSDATWKLFMHLRYCLRFLSTSHREMLGRETPPSDISLLPEQMDELIVILQERLAGWGFDLSHREVAMLPFVQCCFPSTLSSTSKPRELCGRLPILSFHSGTLVFSVFERGASLDANLGNTLTFGPLHLVYRYKSQKPKLLSVKTLGAGVGTFLSDLDSTSTRHHVLSAAVEDVRYTIRPSFIIFLQRLLRLHGKYTSNNPTASTPAQYESRRPNDCWECFVQVKHISVQAAVESMVLAVGLTDVNLVLSVLSATSLPRAQSRLRRFTSGHCLLKSSELYTHVKQADDKAEPFSSNGRNILTSLTSSSLIIDAGYRMTGEHPAVVHGLLTMDALMLSVPRSALLTYRLLEEWRTQYLTNIHVMTSELFAEIEKRQKRQSSGQRIQIIKRKAFLVVEFQTSVKRVGMALQVMHGTWFSWDVHDIVGFLRSVGSHTRNPSFAFGVQLASQTIQIGGQPDETTRQAGKAIKLLLPAFRASGNYDGSQLRSHAIIDNFSLPLKPKYMDDILVVQQNLGTHFYDVLDLIAESRKRRPSSKRSSTLSIKYDVAFMLQGFSIGIEAPTTTLALTSKQVTGTSRNENGSAWDFAVFDLALALSHHSTETRPSSGFDRSLRSAYMVLDVKASSFPSPSPGIRPSRILRLQISRMHAVMSPNSIGELGDLVDHVQAEQHLRQEQRTLELQEIKNKTKRVIRAFEVQKAATSLQRSTSFLDNRTLFIDIADIGIAFPLALKNEIEVDAIGSVPAFLMSIKSATFAVKRNESGHASMGRLSFQFVNQFDQSSPSQFDGDKHHSRNKLLYPGMKADFHSGTSTVARHWHASAYVDGFVLDLDPTIVDDIFGLVDLYRKGKDRIDRLTVMPQPTKLGSDTTTAAMEASYLAVKTSNILVTLVFHMGKLHLRGTQPDIVGGHSILDAESDAPDVIDFPTITVWGDFRATPAASKLSSSQDQAPCVLTFGSRVHRTINRIQPSIFRFLIGFTEKIEDRLRLPDSGLSLSTQTTSSAGSDVSSRAGKEFLPPSVLKGIQLSFSLRIDSSRLELDCAHDLGVVAALHWESGGFVVTVSPGARIVHFAGAITGLEVDLRHLKHQAGTVQTAKADARNLAFSVSYLQMDDIEGLLSHSVSIVVDTEFGAALRFDRLQDILIFKAIYVDRLPGTVPQQTTNSTLASTKPTEGIPGLTTHVLVRARLVNLHVDLGHNVAAAAVRLESLVVRSRIAGSVTDLSVFIADTSLNLEEERPLGGFLRLPAFSFITARQSDVQLGLKDGISKMLDVSLSSGALDVVLQSEKRTLLQYHAEPFKIRIADDWSAIDWKLPPEERTLRLDFSVVGMEVLAVATLQSVPRIINLLSKLRNDLNVQQIDARNALATSSIAQLPKPDNALSEVADAVIRSARSKLSDGPAFSYIIVQRMKLRLANLRLALFRNPNDAEMALFQGRDVHAELERVVHSLVMPPSRRLKLAFSSLYLSKYTSLKYRSIGDTIMAVPWLECLLQGASEWTIARVPAMNLEMNSDVRYEGRQEVLEYDLVATADERAQTSRSIYVSLNLSLYIWAGALVKGLGLEIDKALVTSGFNKSPKAVTAPIASPPPPQAASGAEHDGVKGETLLVPPSASPPASVTMPPPESDAPLRRKYHARSETSIDYGRIEQLGEATPDAKTPWLGLKETVPSRVHEYATLPMEVLMKMLLEVYSKQLKTATRRKAEAESSNKEVRAKE